MSTPVDFEARYQAEGDPWGYTERQYERDKYAATLDAAGPGPFEAALELGSSIGVFSALLAPRCRRLDTIDGAPTAVREARRRLADYAQVDVILGQIPDAIPQRSYDLVVASEILYYLEPDRLDATLTALERRTHGGTRLVAVHWRPAGPERPFTAADAHARLHQLPWLRSVSTGGTEDYLLDVLERR
ncbi:MAG TPA: SAM-dependent methyltransferase [Solirubrobacteraceae bacterium]|jgi:SAM-dependent methyltransferase